MSDDFMRNDYDFDAMGEPKRGAIAKPSGKTRITIMLDDDVIAHFKARSGDRSPGYQTLINAALREHLGRESLEDILRRVVREEMAGVA